MSWQHIKVYEFESFVRAHKPATSLMRGGRGILATPAALGVQQAACCSIHDLATADMSGARNARLTTTQKGK